MNNFKKEYTELHAKLLDLLDNKYSNKTVLSCLINIIFDMATQGPAPKEACENIIGIFKELSKNLK